MAGGVAAGAIVGAFALWLLVETGDVTDQTGALGTNAYDNGAINLWGALLLEFLLTLGHLFPTLDLVEERLDLAHCNLGELANRWQHGERLLGI